MHLPYDSAIPFLGIYPNEMKTYVHTNTCMQIFIVPLFVILETTKSSSNGNGETNCVPYNGISLSNKKNKLLMQMTT